MELKSGSPAASAVPQPPEVPPFLSKCYEMVEDPATDAVVSWGPHGNSFVIWDPHAFSRDLLSKYFKHSNLSSFVRQLNTYGFRKVDPDRFEFANRGFLRGQKHLLKTIIRRKPAQNSLHVQQSQAKSAAGKACLEVGKFGLDEEIERLKRDREVLYKELVKLRQQQQSSDLQLLDMRQRVQQMEQNQQQMLSFLAMAVKNPGLFAQFVQQSENNKRRVDANKRRRIPALKQSDQDELPQDGQLVKYQPFSQPYYPSLEMSTETSDPSNESDSRNIVPSGINDLCVNADGLSIEMDPSITSEADPSAAAYADIIQHLFSPGPENIENFDIQSFEDFGLDFDLPNQDGQMETSESMVLQNEPMEDDSTKPDG